VLLFSPRFTKALKVPPCCRRTPDNCKRRANHERMFPRTDLSIVDASQEPEKTAANDTLAKRRGVEQRRRKETDDPGPAQ
jgi:hypothetical protein